MSLLPSFASMPNPLKSIISFFQERSHDAKLFADFFFFYIKKKLFKAFSWFEKQKNILVKFFLMKRGRYNRPFLHVATMGVLAIGVLIGPFLADTYPIFSSKASGISQLASPSSQEQPIAPDENVFQTDISSPNVRSKDITYTVERGDTISTIAEKFQISSDTIRWSNSLTDDSLSVGDTLKILPVSGIEYKVQRGDTVYSIAKKFSTDAQKIVNWPFNDYANPETFSLVAGQLLIVPDGVMPSQRSYVPQQQTYIAQAPQNVVSSGGYNWPVNGIITQYPIWYHMAYDIAAPIGTPIVATKNGKVAKVEVGGWNYGYGTNVIVDHGDGYSSLYGHMSAVNVSVGQDVIGGRTVIGFIGVTGRTTGPHVHFEIRYNNVTVNPSNFIR